MRHFLLAVFLLTCLSAFCEGLSVIVPVNADPETLYASKELQEHLSKALKKEIKISKENTSLSGRKIYLGNTAFAKKSGIDSKRLEKEVSRIKVSGKDIIITGGKPRGVLYGAYYFLDRKLGVHWFTPYAEYVPEFDSKELEEFTYHGKPAIRIRLTLVYSDIYQRRYAARNLIHRSANRMVPDEKYGEQRIFSPPLNCHGLHMIIPAHKYNLSNHPEFFALQNGKRIDPIKRGGSTDYCLTNPGLIEATARECRNYLKAAPDSKYISIQEGDGTRGLCQCEPCQALVKKCGNRESARWIYFANQVGAKLKDEFPKVKFLVFAYTASRLPPSGIKAEDYVAVQFCSWGGRRGLPYADPKNPLGRQMLDQIREWHSVCKIPMKFSYVFI